jgi:hypothetical protein
MSKEIKITDEFLEKLFADSSRETVGVICSIVETVLVKFPEQSDVIKKLIKNQIYQQFRVVKTRIDAFQDGIDSIKIIH